MTDSGTPRPSPWEEPGDYINDEDVAMTWDAKRSRWYYIDSGPGRDGSSLHAPFWSPGHWRRWAWRLRMWWLVKRGFDR